MLLSPALPELPELAAAAQVATAARPSWAADVDVGAPVPARGEGPTAHVLLSNRSDRLVAVRACVVTAAADDALAPLPGARVVPDVVAVPPRHSVTLVATVPAGGSSRGATLMAYVAAGPTETATWSVLLPDAAK